MMGWVWQALTAAVIVAVVIATLAQTRWGISLRGPRTCPRCAYPYRGLFRKPASLHEALWGGRTCSECGASADKWGQPVLDDTDSRGLR